ncbi:MAG: nodulation protein NfeD [Sulfurimonas sp. RIFOXYD12_FULL_33_39]|uniref:NfeD family protein n=1 Tax=unclassified Sulfurimonas TaxID=2623549 RepID=UPI0008C5D59C|nr:MULTISPECIES: nodulation protein NfeD [unclassified Sulfurimonas]OHE04421.1 MAG: nodulation protein NfeD [Sulfurimonas sp. RIFCSPLOWO2_12_FULL_34_6]OHE09284.1 MAG: nodulation protein NfeD [Sulfurimonas sp. RIFOXYD12_FULL_33_39]OHE12933.1 MAG: nodulation protein NfeD [Sulfurimonas sp. RIFOXYD2_FULL_34_21]
MMRLTILLFLLFLSLSGNASSVVKLDIKGAIGPASSEYLKEGMSFAKSQNAHAVLIELDTPGGLSSSMREMIQNITNSSIPVVTYVSPKGARAASAGTYLLYASHIAAMSPGTNLGAATPVSLMPMPKSDDLNGTSATTLEKKVINDSVAYIKSLAQMNDRNISWALSAVEESKSLSAEDALKYGVIDMMAQDTKELLNKLDGRIVVVADKSITLKTKDAFILNFEANWKSKFLSVITNPNIAYILILIAIYGIFFELMNPGSIFPGVIGAISGVIALYALDMIPFNYAGLLLILLGIAFMVAEVFVTGFGVLGIGGVVAFAFGSVLLFDANIIGSAVSLPLVIAFSLISLSFFVFVMRLFLSSRRAKVVSGVEEMIGTNAEVTDVLDNGYFVHCHGEIWSAVSKSELKVGDRVEVEKISGLILSVKPIKE